MPPIINGLMAGAVPPVVTGAPLLPFLPFLPLRRRRPPFARASAIRAACRACTRFVYCSPGVQRAISSFPSAPDLGWCCAVDPQVFGACGNVGAVCLAGQSRLIVRREVRRCSALDPSKLDSSTCRWCVYGDRHRPLWDWYEHRVRTVQQGRLWRSASAHQRQPSAAASRMPSTSMDGASSVHTTLAPAAPLLVTLTTIC